MVSDIDPAEFVEAVQPVLETQDSQQLLQFLKSRWTASQIIGLLAGSHCDARKVAALCLSLVGCPACLNDLAKQLKDPDPMVNQMAEHAMWSIWFRASTPEANHHLHRGAIAINRRDYRHAITHFNEALELAPGFAEAYNQRAIAKYLLEEYEASIADCLRTVERMPIHFGAWAGMGHCHADLGRIAEAIEAYEKALEINPHLACVRESVAALKRKN
jgi:tetratricopeptide (TPR) repeat protein